MNYFTLDKCDCLPYAKCQSDPTSSKGYKCICPPISLKDQDKVCGSDGRTYTNKDVLRRESCLAEIKVEFLYPGICSKFNNLLVDILSVC